MISDYFLIFDLVDYSVSIKLALKCYRQCGKKYFNISQINREQGQKWTFFPLIKCEMEIFYF